MLSTEGNCWKVRDIWISSSLALPPWLDFEDNFDAIWPSQPFLRYFRLTFSPTAEDNMNVQLKDITVTARDGRVSHLDQVYIRGSHVRFFIVPDMLRCVGLFLSTILIYPLCQVAHSLLIPLTTLLFIGTLPCSVHEASAGAVSVWRVVRPRCSGRAASGGAEYKRMKRRRMGQEYDSFFLSQDPANSSGWRSFCFFFFFNLVNGEQKCPGFCGLLGRDYI